MCRLPREGIAPGEDDVEFVAKGVIADGGVPVELGDEAVARRFIGDAIEYRIVREQRVAGKIHLRDHAGGESRTENGEVNMRGAPGVVVIAPGIRAGANGYEAKISFLIGEHVAGAGEVGIERSVVLVNGVAVTSGGIGLPDFDEGMRNGAGVFIKDAAADDDAFAERGRGVLLGEVAGLGIDHGRIENRASDFGEGVREMNGRIFWSALDGGDVGRMQIVRLGAGSCATVDEMFRHAD